MECTNELTDRLLTMFKYNDKLKLQNIKRFLGITKEEDIVELEKELYNLEINGILYLNQYEEYQLLSKRQDLALAEVRINDKNEIYLTLGKSHVAIPKEVLNGAIVGDIVIIKRPNSSDLNESYSVKKILKRTKPNVMFNYFQGELTPHKIDYPIEIKLPNNQLKKLIEGSRILVNVSLEKTDNCYNGQIISIVGHKNDPDLDVKTIVTSHGIIIDFEKEALKQAESCPYKVSHIEIEKRLNNGGLDLRGETIFTIDGNDTKDIDDAISIKKLANGNYQLGVHIADVSYYIKEDTPLDLEARNRSTSIYPYNAVIPMLPHYLSNGICSLFANEDRMAFSCIMEISPNGEILDYKFVDSIIRSRKQMSYEKINDIYEKQIMYDDYEPYLKDLALLAELGEILNKSKIERGYVSFGEREINFIEQEGEVVGIKKRHRGISQRWIEDFMLAANECAASFTYWQNTPAIYRIHPAPDYEKIKSAIQLFNLNISVPSNIQDPRVLQGILAKIKKYDSTGIYLDYLLQSMKRASYSPDNIGHFGLALTNYTHFTSPIRRYPDLMTHRIIRLTRDFLNLENEPDFLKLMYEITEHASKQERIADKVEKDVEQYKVAEYMENHIGETFNASISYLGHNGINVLTDELILGKIDTETLKKQNFHYDDIINAFIGPEGIKLYLGDLIEVVCTSSNKEKRRVKFKFSNKLDKQKKYCK